MENKYSLAVHGKTFALILSSTAFLIAVLVFPENSSHMFQASVLLQNTAEVIESTQLTLIDVFIRFLVFLLATCGLSLVVMTMLLKMEAKFNSTDDNGEIWTRMGKIPSVAIVETLTFLWVLSGLALAVLLLFNIFSNNMNLLTEVTNNSPESLFGIALVCGLLGGSLASIKFFIPSGEKVKLFNVGFVYKYLANPFFSSVIAFLSYLAFMNMQWFGLNINAGDTSINTLSLIFIFTLVGYFSESFISLLYAFVQKFSEWLAQTFSLKLKTLD